MPATGPVILFINLGIDLINLMAIDVLIPSICMSLLTQAQIMGWRDGLVGKVLAVQARGSEFNPWNQFYKEGARWHKLVISEGQAETGLNI